MHKIVSHSKYSQYLSSCKNVNNVNRLESGDITFDLYVNGESYSIMFFSLSDYNMPSVYLCNPKEGDSIKPHQLYMRKYGLIHLCLSVRDDISVKNKGYKEIIDYTLTRISRLLSLSESEEEKEFRKEFLYFWNDTSTNKEKVPIYIESSKKLKKLKVLSKKDNVTITDHNIEFNAYFAKGYNETQSECFYIPIRNSKGIVPPFKEKPWDIESVRYILDKCISESNVDLLEEYEIKTNCIYLVFEMYIPEILPVSFLLKIEFKNASRGSLYKKIHDTKGIQHWSSQRCDAEYLFKRIGVNITNAKKKALVIGAGSLGSYIIKELPQIGVESITVYDDDDLSYENIMRHRLGALYTNSNKAFAMKFELESSFPYVKVNNKNKKFNEKDISDHDLNQYDIIIIATGGTDFMLNLNRNFKEKQVKPPVMFVWIESKGIGVHSLIIDYKKCGCFQCLYTDAERNKAHYGSVEGDINHIGTGCGGVFNSYGNLTLLKGSAMIIDLVLSIFNERLSFDLNPLYSIRTTSMIKDPDYVIARRDFETSNYFYISERCEVCGLQVQT